MKNMKKFLLIVAVGVAPGVYACTMEIVNRSHDENYQLEHTGPISVAAHKNHRFPVRSYLLHSQTNGNVTTIGPGHSYVYLEERLLKGEDNNGDKLIFLKADSKVYRIQMIKCFVRDRQHHQKVYLSQVEQMAAGQQAIDPEPEPGDSGVLNDYLNVSVEE